LHEAGHRRTPNLESIKLLFTDFKGGVMNTKYQVGDILKSCSTSRTYLIEGLVQAKDDSLQDINIDLPNTLRYQLFVLGEDIRFSTDAEYLDGNDGMFKYC